MVKQVIRYAVMAYLVCSISAMEAWKEDLFHRENEKRALHGVPPLRYSEDLEGRAQEWSDHLGEACDITKNPHAPHDPNQSPGLFRDGQPSGENINKGKMMGNGDIEKMAVSMAPGSAGAWYKEIKYYPFGDYDGMNPPNKAGHFTQMVWKSSEEVGYGLTTCNGDTWFLVARYFPTGNLAIMGGPNNFKENVLPPL